MRLRGEIDHRVDGVLRQEPRHQHLVPDVALDENIARIPGDVRQIGGVARVGEQVEIDQPVQRRALLPQALPDEIASDETTAAGDEKIHEAFFHSRRDWATAS